MADSRATIQFLHILTATDDHPTGRFLAPLFVECLTRVTGTDSCKRTDRCHNFFYLSSPSYPPLISPC